MGTFPANPWGLHDMHGNVWEWCLDHWHGSYDMSPFDGRAWIDHEGQDVKAEDQRNRLLRGGSWGYLPWYCRSAFRFSLHPLLRFNGLGFRVCCLPQD